MTTDDQSDAKVCSLNIEAFGHGEDGINLNWKVDDIVDEIRIDKALKASGFTVGALAGRE